MSLPRPVTAKIAKADRVDWFQRHINSPTAVVLFHKGNNRASSAQDTNIETGDNQSTIRYPIDTTVGQVECLVQPLILAIAGLINSVPDMVKDLTTSIVRLFEPLVNAVAFFIESIPGMINDMTKSIASMVSNLATSMTFPATGFGNAAIHILGMLWYSMIRLVKLLATYLFLLTVIGFALLVVAWLTGGADIIKSLVSAPGPLRTD